MMVADGSWAERLGDLGGAVGWLWLAMAIEWLGCAVLGVGGAWGTIGGTLWW